MDKIAWVRASYDGVVSLSHHGTDPDEAATPFNRIGEYTARMLAAHGLDDADLHKLRIRYGVCYGGQEEADKFYDELHQLGAGNFIGDAMTGISSIVLEELQKYSTTEYEEKLSKAMEKVRYLETVIDFTQDPPLNLIPNEITDDKLLESHRLWTMALEHLLDYSEVRQQKTLQRGDSLIKLPVKDNPYTDRIYILPRKLNKYGRHEYNPHYLAPKKTKRSRVVKTSDPQQVQKFLNEYRQLPHTTSAKVSKRCTIS